HVSWPAASAEFLVAFERAGPELRAAANNRTAGGIHRRQCANGDAAARLRRRRAEAALEIDRGRAEPRAGRAERELLFRRGRGGVAKLAIGRIAAPVLVAAAEQIEQDRRRHDRHPRLAHLETA